jgi:hypothetical protein
MVCPRPPLRVPQQALLPHRPPQCPRHASPDMPRCSEQSRPIRQQGATHRFSRLVSADSELGTLPVSSLLLRSLHTQSGLGRSGGATPHPQQPCAPTVPAHRTHGMGCPLSTLVMRHARGSALRAPQQPCCRTAPARCPRHAPTPGCRALGAEPTDPTLLGHTRRALCSKGARTCIQAW